MIKPEYHFQNIIKNLVDFWTNQGCLHLQSLDLPVGAGTFHRYTFLEALGNTPSSFCYVQPCRRPNDGRFGTHPNRLQHYYQFQVIIKPVPTNIQELYIESIRTLGVDLQKNDLRFVEDNWKSPTLGASGLGWEIWLNGMEVSQYTYFQKIAGISPTLVSVELTYGLERLAMYLQQVDSVYDLIWGENKFTGKMTTYGELFRQSEKENSIYNFAIDENNTELVFEQDLLSLFKMHKESCQSLLEKNLPLPAYEQAVMLSHTFNLLDARKLISVQERQQFMLDIRELTKKCAIIYNKLS